MVEDIKIDCTELEFNRCYNMDCLNFMKHIPNNFFDLIITDPPYGVDIAKSGKVGYSNERAKVTEFKPSEWDNSLPDKIYFKEMLRVSKNQIIFGGNYMTKFLPPSSCWIVWDKRKNEFCNFADCELAWTSFETAIRIFRYKWDGMLQENMKWKEKRFHITQKPIALGRWLLKKYAEKGNTIFDPFAGSGSFLIASKQKGFKFIGCEIDENYYKVINERLSQESLINKDGLMNYFKIIERFI